MIPLLLATACIESTVTKVTEADPVSASVRVEPPALAFGALPAGGAALDTITVSNTGNAALTILSVYLEGDADFALVEPPAPGPLGPGESVEIGVAFTASNLNAHGEVWLLTSDPKNPEVPVPLSGATEEGALLLSPNPLLVGHTDPGGSAEGVLTISNIGHAPVTLSRWYLDRDEFALLEPPELPLTLAPQEALPVDVGFYPDVEGVYEAQLWVAADTDAGAHMETLRGTSGEAYKEHEETPEDGDCYAEEAGYLEHPEARFVVSGAGPVTATYINNGGSYTNELSLASPSSVHIATTHQSPIGATVELGSFSPGEELLLELYVHNTRNTYYSGPAARNPDGFPHVAMSYLGDCAWRVGFEDLWEGGDQDFDDVVITLEGPLQLAL